MPQAQQTVASMLAGYQVSEVDFLNLVRSQMTLFNYELQYWKAFSDAKQALARWKPLSARNLFMNKSTLLVSSLMLVIGDRCGLFDIR